MGTPISMSMKYTDPLWRQYNEGLLKITDAKLANGPILATGCGHFVQRDDPNFVVAQLSLMLKSLETWP